MRIAETLAVHEIQSFLFLLSPIGGSDRNFSHEARLLTMTRKIQCQASPLNDVWGYRIQDSGLLSWGAHTHYLRTYALTVGNDLLARA